MESSVVHRCTDFQLVAAVSGPVIRRGSDSAEPASAADLRDLGRVLYSLRAVSGPVMRCSIGSAEATIAAAAARPPPTVR